MATEAVRAFPIEVPNPDAVPGRDVDLLRLAYVRPRDLSHRELLAGTYTLVERLYESTIDRMVLQDSATVDVDFASADPLRVELLSDDTALTEPDIEQLLALTPDRRLLVALAGPVDADAKPFVLDHPRIDYATVGVERRSPDSQLVEWLESQSR